MEYAFSFLVSNTLTEMRINATEPLMETQMMPVIAVTTPQTIITKRVGAGRTSNVKSVITLLWLSSSIVVVQSSQCTIDFLQASCQDFSLLQNKDGDLS